ncbi:HesA/MoeB/ThiF family protein [Pseudaestuariivita atlantica]|uniref:Molybdopterin-synthase adenylyltransferase n=1 Tax=Pseudaestuariivita atlantica TaxID=1317121 RepID=A0A0L1JT91_9RHOB|nr:molybdopterin-synthase adenylyltransferase MoeB [Pseudaestuariivita atlantica]KNG94979.1 molybdopterin biosynthesis protein [Pseudaestuariivita atlantica]
MLLVLAIAAALWGLGAATQASRGARLAMIGVLLAGVVLAQLVLPDGHPIRAATGGSAAPWLLLAGAGVLVFGYRRLLGGLRARVSAAEAQTEPETPGTFSGTELDRYARHIVLRDIGGPGQRKLKEARVLVVGAGGLGSPALQYLAAAGVGTLGVIDGDSVENANLQRQVIHMDSAIGTPKVFSAAETIAAQNPHVTVRPYHRDLTDDIAAELIAEYDLVLDGTDRTDTRYTVNRACVAAGVPLVSGALSPWEGQVSVFDPARDAPCYACLFPDPPPPGLSPTCAEAGVAGPLPGVVGSMMAIEALKVLTGAGTPLRGRLMIYDALHGETRIVSVPRRADCAVCGATD